jgi:hypothetical protein
MASSIGVSAMPSSTCRARATGPRVRLTARMTSVHASALETTAGSARTASTNADVSGSRATSFTIAEESR